MCRYQGGFQKLFLKRSDANGKEVTFKICQNDKKWTFPSPSQ